MKDFKRLIKKLTITEWLGIVATIAALIILVVALVCGISNANNRITEGVVVDKRYHAAYTTTTYTGSKDNRIAIPKHHPERYVFTIEGNKDGKTVQYTFDVTETQYEQYSIGDYFTM